MDLLADDLDDSSTSSLGLLELRRIFSLANETWVRSYLNTNNPYEEAKLMTEPVQSMYAVSGEHSFTIKVDVTGKDEPNMKSQWLLVPSWNHDKKVVGLFVCDRRKDSDATAATHVIRFVRDDTTGEMLYFWENEESGTVEVMHIRIEGRSKRTSTYLRFNANTFRRVIQDNVLDVSALLDGLSTSCVHSEFKPCSTCFPRVGWRCECAFLRQQATHALDFRFFRSNSEHLFGFYPGVMTLSTYANGQELTSQLFRVHNFADNSTSAMKSKLISGAVQNRMLAMSNTAIPDLTFNKIVMPSDGSSGSLSSNRKKSTAYIIEQDSDVTELTELYGWPPDKMVNENLLLSEAASVAAFQIANAVDELMKCDTMDCWKQHANSSVGGGNCAPLGSIFSEPANWSNIIHTQPIKEETEAAPLLLPRPCTEEGFEPDDKAMRRKIKKREAAERSNTRRRFRRAELKQELRDINEKVVNLRKRKKELEEERAWLKLRLDASSLAIETSHVHEKYDLMFDDTGSLGNIFAHT